MKCKFLRGYKIYELSFLNFNPLGIIWVAWSAGRCVCYLPNSNMFLILTAKNCGRARRKLLTSTSLAAMRPPLPFCINNGRSFSELQRKSVFFHSISFELAINYGLLSKRELHIMRFYPFFSAVAPAVAALPLDIAAYTWCAAYT